MARIMCKSLCYFLLLYGSISLSQDLTKVECLVFERGKGRPLSRVEVRVGDKILYSDPEGRVTIEGLGEAQVLFTKAGFEKEIIPLKELVEDPSVYLIPGEPDDNEVIITGTKRKEISKKTISVRETARIAPGGDPVQVTKILPGVQTNGFSQDLVIRGSGPNDSRYFVDDLRVLNIFHGIGGISIIPENLIDQIEFSSGGFGAQYANATGGIVTLRTQSDVPEESKSEVSLNVPFLTTFYHERPLSEDSSLIVSYRRSLTEFIVPILLERAFEDDDDVFAIPKFSDALVRYLKKEDNGYYKLSLVGSHDGVTALVPNEAFGDDSGKADIEFNQYFGVLGLERRLRLGQGQTIRSTPQVYFTRSNANVGDLKIGIDATEYSAPTEWEKRLGKRRYLYLGFNPISTVADLDIKSPNPNPEDPFFDPEEAEVLEVNRTFRSMAYSLWASLDYELGDFTFVPGLHFFRTNSIDDEYLDPRFSFYYRMTPSFSFKGSIGQYSLEPEPREASEEFGNPNLAFETANHYILGIQGKIGDRWEYDVQGFKKKIYNFIRSDPEKNYTNDGTLLVHGAEIFIRRFMTERVFGWLSYTYSEAKERRSDRLPFYTSPYDQTHILNLAGSYKITAKWELGTRIKFASGTPYTKVTGSYYNANLDKFIPQYDNDNPYSERYSSSDETDIFATYKSYFDSWILTQRFGVQYISVNKASSGVAYNYDYSESELESNSLPPIPYYEIKGTF